MIGDPLLGHKFANYRLDRLIGRGGMASVYYAMDVRLNRPAAVKVIDSNLRDNVAYTTRFIQEARAVATWRHEHIVQIYYAGDEDGIYYFAMEYIDGTTLAKILSDRSELGQLLSFDEILRYGRAIASALDYAHEKGVIHRDVKPLNVMVAFDGRVVLTDFGLVLDTAQGSLGEVFGSAHYTAPEQARRSNAAVPQSDLYSLGVILYEMLTGALPFDDPSPTSVALQHLTLAPPLPSQVNPELSPEVDAVLLRALAKNPEERYQTGVELMDALETAFRVRPPDRISSKPSSDNLADILEGISISRPVTRFDGKPADWRGSSVESHVKKKSPLLVGMLWISTAIMCLIIGTAIAVAITRLRGSSSAPRPTQTVSAQPLKIVLPIVTASPTVLPVKYPTSATSTSTKTVQTRPAIYTATEEPTQVIIQTPSLTPVELVVLPSDTPQPTVTATEIPDTLTPTLKYTDRRKFVMEYNYTGFYLQQLSGVGDLIAGITFERLDSNGNVLNRFSGNRWAKYSSSSLLGWCFRLEITGVGQYLRPSDCEGKYMATIHLESGDPSIFWTTQEGSAIFRVLWIDEELVRCEIKAGVCEVYLP